VLFSKTSRTCSRLCARPEARWSLQAYAETDNLLARVISLLDHNKQYLSRTPVGRPSPSGRLLAWRRVGQAPPARPHRVDVERLVQQQGVCGVPDSEPAQVIAPADDPCWHLRERSDRGLDR
jgi:hypothetical protein